MMLFELLVCIEWLMENHRGFYHQHGLNNEKWRVAVVKDGVVCS